MKRLLISALCVVLAACGPEKKAAAPAPEALPTYANLRDSDCYTVDLFDPVQIKAPGSDVPVQYHGFLGEWGGGAWNGKWCHDLVIYEVRANGEVELLSMHAPNFEIGYPPTVFKRTAVIDINNTLRLVAGDDRMVYNLDRQFLVGKRTGKRGDYQIALTRKGSAPFPVFRPASTQLATN
ncbi:MAG: hypothetical protein AAGC79_12320 [Pseudomonadota bacterium]